jgi:uncharacterized Zn finger protein
MKARNPKYCCPKCGSADSTPYEVLKRNINPIVFFLGGWIVSIFYSLGMATKVRCNSCNSLYSYRTAGAWISIAILIFLVGLIAYGIYIQVTEPDIVPYDF